MGEEETLRHVLGVIHDLRQPVAAIRFVVDTARSGTALSVDLAHLFDTLDGHASWMSVLLSQSLGELTTVAPEEADDPCADLAGTPPPSRGDGSPVRLDVLVADVATAVSSGQSGALVVQVQGDVCVAVDDTAMRRALGNLLDNAFRAAGPGGTIRVRVGADGPTAVLSVDDDGPGFGRVGSRSRLGLSMVAETVVTAGGRMEIARSDLGGARVSLRLPAVAPARTRAKPPT